MNYETLQKSLIKSILNHRDWKETTEKFKIKVEEKYFTDKYLLIYKEILKSDGNLFEMNKSNILINAKIDINNPFPNIPVLSVIDCVENIKKEYNKIKFKELWKSSYDSLLKSNDLEKELIVARDNILNLIEDEAVNDYSMKKFIADKYYSDMERTDNIIGYNLNRMKGLNYAISGIQAGFIVISGNSNAGKSVFLNNIEIDLIESNKDVFVLKFSLDDTKEDCINTLQSVLSKGTLKRNDIKTPKILSTIYRYLTDFSGNITTESKVETIEKKQVKTFNVYGNVNAKDQYDLTLEKITNYADERVKIFDNKNVKTFNDLETLLRKYLELFKDKKLVVMIDGIMNLDISQNINVRDTNSVHDARANLLKQLADIYDIPLIVTTELRKVESQNNKFREPTKNDLKYSNKYDFNAKLILLLSHNDTNGLDNNQVYNKMIIAKNKFTEHKFPMYYEFKRAEAYMTFDDIKNNNWNYCESRYKESIENSSIGVRTR